MLKAYSRNCKAHIKEFLGILHFTIIKKKKIGQMLTFYIVLVL